MAGFSAIDRRMEKGGLIKAKGVVGSKSAKSMKGKR